MIRRGSQAIAAARVAVGVVALARPAWPARPWVGARGGDVTATVFGRALGARDLALGLGTLNALRGTDDAAAAWVAAGALSDALDVAASAASWRELPRFGRWLVVASAGGAAVAGAVGAAALAFGGSRKASGRDRKASRSDHKASGDDHKKSKDEEQPAGAGTG